MWYLCEAKDFGHKQDKTRQNFLKIEYLALRKTLLNTVNFRQNSGQSLPNFQPFFMAWLKVNEIELIQVILTIFALNLSDFHRLQWEIARFYES